MMKLSLVTLVLSQESNEENKNLNDGLKALAEQDVETIDWGFDEDVDEDKAEIGGDQAETGGNQAETGGDQNEVETVEISTSSPVSQEEPSGETVSCGAHQTASCAECVSGACDNKADDNQCHVSAWCNGDCVWESDACKASTTKGKSCGQHQAASCESCPPTGVDDQSRFCNGECKWDEGDNSCKDKN